MLREHVALLPSAAVCLLLAAAPGFAAPPPAASPFLEAPGVPVPPLDNAAAAPAEGVGPGPAGSPAPAVDNAAAPAGRGEAEEDEEEGEGAASPAEPAPAAIRDPAEPVNRAIFVFNDKAYSWVMKPVARGYRAVTPEPVRVALRNFFSNVTTPARLVNNVLQGRLGDAGTELARFVINTTIGLAGFFDPARNRWSLEKRDEDLGLTFGRYGLGHGLYIVLPLLGPSSLRDAVGLAGDGFLDPVNYVGGLPVAVGVHAFRVENELSLRIGDYEDLTGAALDPYVAVRDAYAQYRAKKLSRGETGH